MVFSHYKMISTEDFLREIQVGNAWKEAEINLNRALSELEGEIPRDEGHARASNSIDLRGEPFTFLVLPNVVNPRIFQGIQPPRRYSRNLSFIKFLLIPN